VQTLTIVALLVASSLALGGEISDYHTKRARDKLDYEQKSRSDEVAFTNHGIIEIGIERSGCYGSCPIYSFIVKNDGTARYNGVEHVERKGAFTGTTPVFYFHSLAQFIRDSGYMELKDIYTSGIRHGSTTYTLVVMNGKRKTVSNADAGPTKLWAIEQLIDSLVGKTQWRDSSKAEKKPIR
jgi:hypothetical protein